ncbi:hypothetical protein [Methanoculleus chikugoensis]|uniref:hypothetical protein n=1 Tax=Methanoculleus chikugoensis TaxID=118126 RepID=UPI001FD09DF7|nr:hypothetical protein [Methanoculleus chikugoensis]
MMTWRTSPQVNGSCTTTSVYAGESRTPGFSGTDRLQETLPGTRVRFQSSPELQQVDILSLKNITSSRRAIYYEERRELRNHLQYRILPGFQRISVQKAGLSQNILQRTAY